MIKKSTDMSNCRINYREIQGDDLSIHNQLCILIYQTANRVSRLYGSLLAPHDLTFPQYQVLIVLWDRGSSTIGAICSALSLDTSTITPVVKRLEALGYVTRYRDRTDERKVYVSLTEKGLAFRQEAQSLRCKLMGDLAVGHVEFVETRRFLQGLSRSIDRILGRQPSTRLTA